MEAALNTGRTDWARWARAFREAPWRRQTQLVATLALAVVVLAAIGGIYLAEASRAATAGRDVQNLRERRDELLRENDQLQARIASYQNVAALNDRAVQLGFVPAKIEQLEFIRMPQYRVQPPATVAEPELAGDPLAGLVAYEESLGAWLLRQIPLLLGQRS